MMVLKLSETKKEEMKMLINKTKPKPCMVILAINTPVTQNMRERIWLIFAGFG